MGEVIRPSAFYFWVIVMGEIQQVRMTFNIREIYIRAMRMLGFDPFIAVYNNPLTEKFDENKDIFLFNAIDMICHIVLFCTIEKNIFLRSFEESECMEYIFDILTEDSCIDSDEISTELTETYSMRPVTGDNGEEYWVNQYGAVIDEIRWLSMPQLEFLNFAYQAFLQQVYTNLTNVGLLELLDRHHPMNCYFYPTESRDGWGNFRKTDNGSRFRHLENLRHNMDRVTITYTMEVETNIQ